MYWFARAWGIWLIVLIILGSPFILTMAIPSPIRYSVLPIPAEPQGVRPDAITTLTVSRCNDTPFAITYTTTWELIRASDQLIILLPATGQTAQPGCLTYRRLIQLVPLGTPPGTYYVAGIISYATPWRDYAASFTTTSFEVLP